MDLWSLSDLTTPWCLRVVVTLRVAEHLAAGATEIGDLAAACDAHPDSLQRVLRHLVGVGVFAEQSPGRFVLNDAARGLLDSSIRLGLDLDGFGGRMTYAWASLLSAVKSGTASYREIFGRPFWDDLDAHPRIADEFDALMGPAGHGTPDPNVLLEDDWGMVRTVVDVGGGTGTLLAEVLRAHPDVRGVLVDLPRPVAASSATFTAAGVADRASAVAQSFFDPLPRGADVYLLKSVLSDWPDAEATTILGRCAEAARPAGRVVILNGVSPDTVDPPADILMMVLVGGKSRTLAEFRPLAAAAGLRVERAERQQAGRFLVECRPAAE